jgi:N-acetylglucosamine-6-sulfatase
MKAITQEGGARLRDELRIRELESLRAVDEGVGRITELLERAGVADHTIVIYTADHGIHWGEHWLGDKFSAYEESIRVPYVVRYPLRTPLGGTRDELVLNLDLAPTLIELAGATVPRNLDGESLVPLLGAAGVPWRSDFLIESPGELIAAPSQAVRTERWKYIETNASKGVTRELYDLAADPYESENLAVDEKHATVRASLEERLDSLRHAH